eukprot:754678-Pelagomonas_calceolata.AAC.3
MHERDSVFAPQLSCRPSGGYSNYADGCGNQRGADWYPFCSVWGFGKVVDGWVKGVKTKLYTRLPLEICYSLLVVEKIYIPNICLTQLGHDSQRANKFAHKVHAIPSACTNQEVQDMSLEVDTAFKASQMLLAYSAPMSSPLVVPFIPWSRKLTALLANVPSNSLLM